MLIDFGRAPQTHAERLEPWAWSIGQAPNTLALAALEERLHRRIDLLRGREASMDVEREALILCAERRAELLAGAHAASSPAAPGGSPAFQAAHAVNPLAQETW